VQSNSNECIVRGLDGELIVAQLCKRNLHEIKFSKGHGTDVANSAQS
jgi:hypothetical protein